MPTNVAKTQDVLLDGTIFLGNTGQKDGATFMNKNIPKELSQAFRNLQAQQHSLTMKARGDVHANKCCYNLECPVGRYYLFIIFFGNNDQRDKTN